MDKVIAFGSGLAGATALTLLHETIRKTNPDAPRMDLLGMSALSKTLRSLDTTPPNREKLFIITMAGDLVSNALYYSAAGIGSKKHIWLRGIFLGLSAGLGAVLLPKPLGLNERHSNRTTQTQLMTVGLYLVGGLVTAATLQIASKKKKKLKNEDLIF